MRWVVCSGAKVKAAAVKLLNAGGKPDILKRDKGRLVCRMPGNAMNFYANSLRIPLRLVVTLSLVGVVSLFIHELGHGIATEALGGKFEGLYVMPGVQVWPHPGQPYAEEWQGYVGLADLRYDPDWALDGWQAGLVDLMGSGSNLLAAVLALGALWMLRPFGWLRRLLVAETLMFTDILLYTFLPQIGLQHLFFIGGAYAEPLEGAVKLGCPAWAFMLLVALISILMAWGLDEFVRRNAKACFIQAGPTVPRRYGE